jgi:hypothetical protein
MSSLSLSISRPAQSMKQQVVTLFDVRISDGRLALQGVDIAAARGFCHQWNAGGEGTRARVVPAMWKRVE